MLVRITSARDKVVKKVVFARSDDLVFLEVVSVIQIHALLDAAEAPILPVCLGTLLPLYHTAIRILGFGWLVPSLQKGSLRALTL